MDRSKWEYKKLGEFTSIRTGKLDANAADVNGVYPFFTCSKEPLSINSYSYDCECLLIAGNGDLNVKYYKGKFDAYQRTYIIQLKNDVEGIDMHYLYLFFSKYIEILRKKSIGGVIKYIKLGDLTEAIVPIYSITDQQRIVAELDCLNEMIALKQEQLKEFDKLAQSIFYDMFGDPIINEKEWDILLLSQFGKVTTGNTPSRKVPEYYDTDFIEWIKTDNIDKSEMYPSLAKEYLSESGAKLGRIVERESLLITCIAGSLSSIGGVCITNRKVAFNQQINAITPNEKVDSVFFYYLIKTSGEYIRENATTGMKHIITKSSFENLKLPLPPLALQQQFAEKIHAIEAQKELVKQSIAETQQLLDSRMDYYFD